MIAISRIQIMAERVKVHKQIVIIFKIEVKIELRRDLSKFQQYPYLSSFLAKQQYPYHTLFQQ